MKKILGLLLALLVCAAVVPALASAETSGTWGDNLTWVLDDSGKLTISGTGEMASFDYDSSDAWHAENTSINEVVIEDGVTSIGDDAFYECSSLTSITLPDSVTSIGDYAFRNCYSLTSITIPDGVTSIPDSAFAWCSSLTSITLPDGVTSIGDTAFIGCSNLTSITLPEGVTSIGEYAFFGCSSLTSITLPDSVTRIGRYAFERCSNLKSITLPDGITSIRAGAFYECSSLTSITLPDGVTSVGDYAFQSCSSLTSITLPESVTSIGYDAFYNCSSLTSITLPEGVTSIGSYAFEKCNSLTSITLPDGVSSIGSAAFSCCSGLTSITLPEGVTIIGYRAFYNCSSLMSITLPEGVTSIGEDAFAWCRSLTSITLPEGVTSIGKSAFYYCSSLTSITLPNSLTSIGEDAIPMTATIRCHRNTYADQWATENGYTVEYIICDEHTTVTDAAVEPTCTETGLTEGSHCSVCGEVLVAQTVVPAKGHSYGEPTYEWSADNKTVTASRVCANDVSHVESETVNAASAVTKPATCEAKGETTWTSAAFENTAFVVQTRTEANVDALGHSYGEPTYEWSADNKTVTASRSCANDASHVESETVNVSEAVTREATRDAEGERTYTATFTNAAFAVQTRTEAIPKLTVDAAVIEAEEKIKALPATIATTDKTAVEAAKAAYEALTDDQKALVDSATQSKLTKAETDLKAAEDAAAAEQKAAEEKAAADKKAADDVIGTINALPASAGVADKGSVAAARAAYDALTDEQKALVSAETLNKLTAAESQVTAAEAAEAEAAAQKAAEESAAQKAAEEAAQKAAEEAAAQKAAADQAAASAAAEKINALPASAGVADKDAVAAARAAYDALSDEQKALVGAEVAGKLAAAESQVSEAEAAAAAPAGPVPGPHADDTGNYTINADLTATYEGPVKKVSKVKSAKIPDEIVVEGVPVKVTAVADKAFYKASKLTKVSIGANVKTIGKSAFASCAKLKTVSGGSGMVTIGASAFKGDKALTKITIGKKVTTIGKSAFNGCKKLKTVTIKSSKLKKVGSSAFKGVASNVTFKCPSKQLKAYKKLIKKAGAPSKAKYKK